ncbi:hypothetical protein L6164_028149 [Bauhinia variegata]|uniref:Uncharacterized protein n=1 Tax=Bauhinia variegata TaxID=167791 RepID=A0ACB9LVH9_BAUVA|nr:hypothetical protein L6164_028149 [Bauhinia variegata]
MCVGSTESNAFGLFHSFARKRRSKRPKLQVYRLTRSLETTVGKDLELKNLKLYLENQIISEKNAELRKKANRLRQENFILSIELQQKFPQINMDLSKK